MKLNVSQVEGKSGTVVAIGGEIGYSEIQELKLGLDDVLGTDSGALLIDLEHVSFIASDGLGVFIRARAKAEEHGKAFFLVRPQPRIHELLCKTQLTKIFSVCSSMDIALAEL